ncbi:MAG: riboflavin synthase [Chitinophagales bacterium]|jgi:riboflavin synthase|nr:riboflavin synthase [Chitinophagales bacterium]
MFTGIIKDLGKITHIKSLNDAIEFTLVSKLTAKLSIDNSLSHNGICLTITEILDDTYKVVAIRETIEKTTISHWQIGDYINLEPSMGISDSFGGHIVQGHIDSVAEITKIQHLDNSTNFTIQIPPQYNNLIIEKGSVCLDGISLTTHSLKQNSFQVSLIPFTLEHTNASIWGLGQKINIEFDMIGKYLNRYFEQIDSK